MAGYHLTEIPKGKLGEFSKIEEEFLELKDSLAQNNKVMALIELSDMLGAIDAYLRKEFNGSLAIEDIWVMTKTTKRAFESGARKIHDDS